MPYPFTIPFQAFRVPFQEKEDHIFMPVGKPNLRKLGGTFDEIEEGYSKYIQKQLLDKGSFSALLTEISPFLTHKDTLILRLPASKDGFTHPELELPVEFFYGPVKNGFWGVAPVFSMEAASSTVDGLKAQFAEIIQFELKSVPPSELVHKFLTSIWHPGIELQTGTLTLAAPSLDELSKTHDQQLTNFLPEVTVKLPITGDPVFGLDTELQQVMQTMRGGFGRSILVVGPEGSGKSALIAEAVRLHHQDQLPGSIYGTSANRLIQGLTVTFGWQFNISFFCRELELSNSWLYVRNFAELFEVGRYEGNEISIGQYLKNYLGRGEISLVSECTPEELQYIESQNPNISSLFTVVRVFPPRADALEEVIQSKIALLAKNHGVEVTSGAIREAIRLHHRYNPYSGMPGQVIRFLERIIAPSDRIKSTQSVTVSEVIDRFCTEHHIPPVLVSESVPFLIDEVEAYFRERVFGQEAAVSAVVSMLVKEKMRLSGTHKPVASFLFVGPTGVGKTELAKVLTTFVFGDVSRITRFDMSEYAGSDAVFRLTGIRDSEGLLTSAVRRAPFSVLLFDEIEKAHPLFFNLLLQILDQGRLTDFRGNLINFCSTIIIMTSNIGADSLKRTPIQLRKVANPELDLQNHYKRAVENKFPPELVNRFDEIIPFASLTPASIRQVVNREIDLLIQRDGIRYQSIILNFEDKVRDYLAVAGFHPLYGARFLQRTVHNEIVLPLAEALKNRDKYEKTEVNIHIGPQTGKPEIEVQVEEMSFINILERIYESNNLDWISRLRRKMAMLKNSAPFREAKWNLRNLQRERDRPNNKQFWRDNSSAENLAKLESFFEQYHKLANSISGMELDVFVDYFEGQSKNEWLEKYLPEFEEAILTLVKKLYTIANPDYGRAEIVILGRNLPPIVDFYTTLFTKHQLEWKIMQLWNSPGNSSVESGSRKTSDPFVKGPAGVRIAFIENHHDYFTNNGDEQDELLGLMFSLTGEAAFTKLKHESGIQLWESEEAHQERYCVVVTHRPILSNVSDHVKDVENLHKRPRRTIRPTGCKDLQYNLEDDNLQDFKNAISKKWDDLLEAEVLEIL